MCVISVGSKARVGPKVQSLTRTPFPRAWAQALWNSLNTILQGKAHALGNPLPDHHSQGLKCCLRNAAIYKLSSICFDFAYETLLFKVPIQFVILLMKTLVFTT